jgi:hypothetical protein
MATTEATDGETSPTAPPGLHAAASEDRECGNCVYYRSNGDCREFPPLRVSDEWLCGAWKAGGKDTDDSVPPAKTVRDAQRQSLARIRAART